MKIAFHEPSQLDYTPDTPYRRPLGGTQSSVAYLSAALAARGHDVTLYNRTSQVGVIHGVNVVGLWQTSANNLNAHDVVVSATYPCGTKFRRAGVRAPMVMWQHQAPDAPLLAEMATADERAAWSAYVFVSDDQRLSFKTKFGVDGAVLRNAAAPDVLAAPLSADSFLDRGEDPVLIYASAPGRGLDFLLVSFAAARERLPGLRLQVCSDQGIYQEAADDDVYSAFYALARALPGVEFTGSLSQAALGRQYAQADLMAYPTTFQETSCIVAMEAASAGCVFVGADRAALRETLSGYGVFMPFINSRALLTRTYAQLLIDTIAAARADPAAYGRRRLEQAAYFRETHTWARRAQEWEAWLESFLASPVAARL